MAGQVERFHPQAPKELDKYLIPTEQIIFLIRRHWIVLFEPIATVVAGLIVVGFLDQELSGGALRLRDIAIVIWFIVVLRLFGKFLDWYRELFLATDRRLMLVSGLVTRQVDIMPMSKVTDMRYDRTLTGQLFGYGVYILESAGQDQALSKINFVPDPDLHYKQISAVIFAPSQRRLSDKLIPASTGSKIPISEPEQAWWRRS
jgi:Bacterial PH domain